ncbi:xylose isomerase-like TIM barrel [Clostridium puniceum]|uniref:Xylose isomerase-like TIM barrel n=2 Tax=Clostridium puniceum TaxID=29367 RepID=A0A1S8THX5_9CLOT|nr:xylose isomerase-like TIM barrel [Clostridium puniceum]
MMKNETLKNTFKEKNDKCPPLTISSWTLGDQCKFEERVKAAKEAGYDGIGLRAETYVDALNEGLFDSDILDILEKYNMKVTEVEYITLWAEDNRSYEQKYKEQLCFHMCELFDVQHINIGLMENYSVEHTAQKLKELCQRAGKYIIGVEPMPYSGIPDIKKGWAVVEGSGCDNAKLILDTWHWVRANQANDVKLLEGIPADKFISIQINDVYERPYAKSILRDESMHDRLAPGTGINVTEGFVRMIKEKGIKPACIGVEVISDAILAKGVAEAAKYTFDNTKKVLDKAWPEVSPEK